MTGDRDAIGKPVWEFFAGVPGQGMRALLDHIYATGERYVGRAQPVRLKKSPQAPAADQSRGAAGLADGAAGPGAQPGAGRARHQCGEVWRCVIRKGG